MEQASLSIKKNFVYLQANKAPVNLGFYKDFKKFNDPEDLLEDTGKTTRHIKLKNLSDVNLELLTE